MKRYTLALDLVNNKELIQEYEEYHRNVSPEIKESIVNAGVVRMDIYRFENRLFMIMDVDDSFTFERKSLMDAANEKVQIWEQLMWKYQQAIPGSENGAKWVLMKQIFEL
ncbi:L-rhamnose mutarotase [Sphingobacterium rhinopitheci]|uniref:L-rhamnose mutarotase n=1 Tax=Sphingobacterium rhinopitheci TaxID=2781960 RepID=UPI001F521092|nr:L-rhamnose mutarotase [Sphingobacterium rhinopitheci]MCI0922008.1 L-rhamnose mutarotase [Sphingobacterium rhinopitheci]